MAVEDLLDSMAEVQRKQHESDGQGGHTIDYEIVATAACRVGSMSARDLAIAGQKQAVVTHPIYFAPAADVQVGDRLVIEGRTFEVRVPNQAGPSHPYTKVLAEEYQLG